MAQQEYIAVTPTKATNTEIHVWRMRAAVLWSIFLQFVVLSVYIVFINFDIFHPVSWIVNCLTVFFSLNFLPKILILIFIIFIQGEVCKKDYISGPLYHTTRFKRISYAFCIRNLLLLFLHMIIGGTLFWIYISLNENNYTFLTRPCKSNHSGQQTEFCLDESKLFLYLGGLWIGIYYFTNDYIYSSRILSFPLIQQYKFYRMKAAMNENIKQSVKRSVLPTIIFIGLYYFYGSFFRGKSIELLSCRSRLDTEPIDSWKGLLNIHLMLQLWVLSAIFTVALETMELIFNVYLTEHCVFPVSTAVPFPGNNLSLIESLRKIDVPIIHHLGYFDLWILSSKCVQRREDIFKLSNPGGHPHAWNGILYECISLIKTFTTNLDQALQQEITPEKEVNKSAKAEFTSFRLHSHGTDLRKLGSPFNKSLNSFNFARDRSVAYRSWIETLFNNIQNWFSYKMHQLLKKPYIAYFFSESPDSRINYLLSQSQPVIWAVQSLAFLSATSLKEDCYGVVQKDLADIISTIVNLKLVVDKLFKQNLIVKKSFSNDLFDVQMKYMLRTSVKRSLYKIAITFNPYIKDLKLPTDTGMQMSNFREFKEV